MKPTAIVALGIVPLLSFVHAQNPVVSTSFSTIVSVGPNRVLTTVVSAFPITLTPSSQMPSTTPGAGGASGSQSLSGAVSGSSLSPSSTTPGPTAPTNVSAGGSGGAGGGAPAPGQNGPNGIYGPPDGYVSAGEILDVTFVLGTVIGAVTGGLLVFA